MILSHQSVFNFKISTSNRDERGTIDNSYNGDSWLDFTHKQNKIYKRLFKTHALFKCTKKEKFFLY